MTEADKKKIINLIKNVDIQEMVIPEEAKRKWFKFGAYEMARLVVEEIKRL